MESEINMQNLEICDRTLSPATKPVSPLPELSPYGQKWALSGQIVANGEMVYLKYKDEPRLDLEDSISRRNS